MFYAHRISRASHSIEGKAMLICLDARFQEWNEPALGMFRKMGIGPLC